MNQYLVIDKNALSRETIASCLYDLECDSIIYESESIELAANITAYYKTINTVILSIDSGESACIERLTSLKRMIPDAKCLVISANSSNTYIEGLLKSGAHAVISVSSNRNELITAIRSLQAGQTYIGENYLTNALPANQDKDLTQPCEKNGHIKFNLTDRQKQVLNYITKGYANKLIAYELGVSEGTIKLHVSSILRALKVTNRTEAALHAGQVVGTQQ